MSHTFAELEVSQTAFDEIAGKLRDAGYDHAFVDVNVIDMHGIGITRSNQETTMGIRAKMRLNSLDGGRAKFSCEYDPNSAEDQSFTKATPSGNAEYQIDNPKAVEQLQVGKTYYFDISPAE